MVTKRVQEIEAVWENLTEAERELFLIWLGTLGQEIDEFKGGGELLVVQRCQPLG